MGELEAGGLRLNGISVVKRESVDTSKRSRVGYRGIVSIEAELGRRCISSIFKRAESNNAAAV